MGIKFEFTKKHMRRLRRLNRLEGERWSAIGEFDGRECIYLDSGCLEAIEPDDAVLRDRTAAVCDGTEQFRALHAALKEAGDQ